MAEAVAGRGKGRDQGCACCAFSSHPAGGSEPPGRDKGTGNVILLLEGVKEELQRAVLAHGYLSAFAMILCSNGTELLGDSGWQQHRHIPLHTPDLQSHCRPAASSFPVPAVIPQAELHIQGDGWSSCAHSSAEILPVPAFHFLPSQLAASGTRGSQGWGTLRCCLGGHSPCACWMRRSWQALDSPSQESFKYWHRLGRR